MFRIRKAMRATHCCGISDSSFVLIVIHPDRLAKVDIVLDSFDDLIIQFDFRVFTISIFHPLGFARMYLQPNAFNSSFTGGEDPESARACGCDRPSGL
ncbi:hypothetical protein Y032_0003g1178 [Ancylostoma ceylanicum]|uniref:Uncharacterized protein n=1 Tax=Ancylostoma ceylanicum TaxID=53326 RepID=A0A016VVQ3_9BILA|nr:hypothetical protein Y032_0003g1178 [Ancylostoma ceylanicum]